MPVALSFGRRCAALALAFVTVSGVWAADITEDLAYRGGKYEEGIKLAAETIAEGRESEEWHHVKIEAEMALGRYADARASLAVAIERFPTSIRLRWLGRDVHRFSGDPHRAEETLGEIEAFANSSFRYRDAANQVIAGHYYLPRGNKQVLRDVQQGPTGDAEPAAWLHRRRRPRLKTTTPLPRPRSSAVARRRSRRAVWLCRAYAVSDSKNPSSARRSDQAQSATCQVCFKVDEHVGEEQYAEADALLDRVLASILKNRPPGPIASCSPIFGDADRKSPAEPALAQWRESKSTI
jgi:hypothetical protein